MQPTRKVSPAIASLIVIVLIGIVATIAVAVSSQPDETVVTTMQTQDSMSDSSSTSQTESEIYKNGNYTKTGNYISPGGRESIEVTVTLSDDIISEVAVTGDARSGEAKEYQDAFISNYKKLVVGKDIDEVSLSRVAGSSLTSNGFNDALEQIKEDART